MRVLHLAAWDHGGGAARGSLQLHRTLLAAGVDSHLLAGRRNSSLPGVHGPRGPWPRFLADQRAQLDARTTRLAHGEPHGEFTAAVAGAPIARVVRELRPDLVHLHYLGKGFVVPEQLARVNRPLVWTLRGMWPFTGGCEYDGGCGRHVATCGSCPVLGSERQRDLSRLLHARKRRAFAACDLHLVGLSRWIAEAARSSSLFRDRPVDVIPPGIDLDAFRPQDRDGARRALGLPAGARIVAFSGYNSNTDPRKGWQELRRALELLAARGGDDLLLLLIGPTTDDAEVGRAPVPHVALGHLRDDVSLTLAYAAADVVAVPSLQETFGKVAAEALACGVPAVGFAGTGVADIVEDGVSGRLVRWGSAEALADGLAWALERSSEGDGGGAPLRSAARRRAEERFGAEREGEAYQALYERVLGSRAGATGPVR